MKKAEGIAEALRIEDDSNHRANEVISHADTLVIEIDPKFKKHIQKRYTSRNVDIDFGESA